MKSKVKYVFNYSSGQKSSRLCCMLCRFVSFFFRLFFRCVPLRTAKNGQTFKMNALRFQMLQLGIDIECKGFPVCNGRMHEPANSNSVKYY